jgi:hypothetical protein
MAEEEHGSSTKHGKTLLGTDNSTKVKKVETCPYNLSAERITGARE